MNEIMHAAAVEAAKELQKDWTALQLIQWFVKHADVAGYKHPVKQAIKFYMPNPADGLLDKED